MDKHKTINREQKFKKESQSSLERDSTVIFSLFYYPKTTPRCLGSLEKHFALKQNWTAIPETGFKEGSDNFLPLRTTCEAAGICVGNVLALASS